MATTMKALVKKKREPGLWMDEVPVPEIGPNDVLVKIRKTAICGTDLHIYNWDEWSQRTIPVPMVTGHEFVGVVEQVGAQVTGFAAGRPRLRRGAHHLRPLPQLPRRPPPPVPQHARRRRQPPRLLRRVPQHPGRRTPSSCRPRSPTRSPRSSTRSATRCTPPSRFDLVGEDVLITGAGPIGIMAVAIARHVGARHVVITDVNEYRLELAKRMNADAGGQPASARSSRT